MAAVMKCYGDMLKDNICFFTGKLCSNYSKCLIKNRSMASYNFDHGRTCDYKGFKDQWRRIVKEDSKKGVNNNV